MPQFDFLLISPVIISSWIFVGSQYKTYLEILLPDFLELGKITDKKKALVDFFKRSGINKHRKRYPTFKYIDV